jgi:hypothetical protein
LSCLFCLALPAVIFFHLLSTAFSASFTHQILLKIAAINHVYILAQILKNQISSFKTDWFDMVGKPREMSYSCEKVLPAWRPLAMATFVKKPVPFCSS